MTNKSWICIHCNKGYGLNGKTQHLRTKTKHIKATESLQTRLKFKAKNRSFEFLFKYLYKPNTYKKILIYNIVHRNMSKNEIKKAVTKLFLN